MNLRDRLEAAKAERRMRAGLPADEPDESPMHQPSVDRDVDASVDLTGIAPVVDLRPVPPIEPDPSFTSAFDVGVGDTCPSCGSSSRLDMEDVVGGVDHYSCTGCGLLYQVAR
jgi:hypothetical protein